MKKYKKSVDPIVVTGFLMVINRKRAVCSYDEH